MIMHQSDTHTYEHAHNRIRFLFTDAHERI